MQRRTPAFPESLLATGARADGRRRRPQGAVQRHAQLVGRNGKVISTGGAPGLGFSVHPHGNQRFNPLKLVAGHWPEGDREVAIDANTAEQERLQGGPDDRRRSPAAPSSRCGSPGSCGSAASPRSAAPRWRSSTSPSAQHLLQQGGASSTRSRSPTEPGYTPAAAGRRDPAAAAARRAGPHRRRSRPSRPPSDTSGFLNSIQNFLLAFAGIALFVGSFVIANTLSITIAQRTRELGDAAHARRDPPPGAPLGAARSVRDRPARLGRRPAPRARARQGAERAVQVASASTSPRPRTVFATRTVDRLARSSGVGRHAARGASARRCARRACRRSRPCARARCCRRRASRASGPRPRC